MKHVLKYVLYIYILLHTLGGCQLRQICGMAYNPFMNKWKWSRTTSVNYAVHSTKSSQVVTDDVIQNLN